MKLSLMALLLLFAQATVVPMVSAHERSQWTDGRFSGRREFRSDWQSYRPFQRVAYRSDERDSRWGERQDRWRNSNRWSRRNLPPGWAVARGWDRSHPHAGYGRHRL